jgi:hypothetical protein
MLAVLTFWLLLGLPGLAWLQRVDPASLERGGLSVIARAYFASLALLTPVSALGFLFGAPLWILSAWAVIAIVVAAVALARDRRWFQLFGPPSAAALACGLWLAFDLWVGARAGSHVQGDAGFHIARIRLIAAYGFNNWDPLLSGNHFEPIYHSNLYHALIAATSQLTRLDPGAVWVWVWPLAKLLAAAGAYELAVSVLGLRGPGYVAAVTATAFLATTSTLAFPNTFAPYAIMPFALACGVDALSRPSFRNAAWLGVSSVVLAQTHLLYALFLVLAVAPVMALRLLDALIRTRRRRRELLAASFAFALALPWFYAPARPKLEQLWAAASEAVSWVSVASAQARPPRATERAASRFRTVPPDMLRMDPAPFLDASNSDLHGFAALGVVLVLLRRRQALALAAITATICAWLFVPALCTPLVALLVNWVVLRFTQLFFVVDAALVPACVVALALVAGAKLRARGIGAAVSSKQVLVLRAAVELAGIALGFAYANQYGSYAAPWSKEVIWRAALGNNAQINADRITRRAKFFTANVAPGSAVMAPLLRDYDIPMHCPCHAFVYRKGRGERAQPDLEAKRAAVERFYARDTPNDVRLEILRNYGVRYVFSGPRRAAWFARVFKANVLALAHEGDDAIVTIAP